MLCASVVVCGVYSCVRACMCARVLALVCGVCVFICLEHARGAGYWRVRVFGWAQTCPRLLLYARVSLMCGSLCKLNVVLVCVVHLYDL